MTESISKAESEFAGTFGRAVVRFDKRFHSLVWRDPLGNCVAKLYPALQAGSGAQCVADALKCVHNNVPPPPGARSMRRTTRRGMQPVGEVVP